MYIDEQPVFKESSSQSPESLAQKKSPCSVCPDRVNSIALSSVGQKSSRKSLSEKLR